MKRPRSRVVGICFCLCLIALIAFVGAGVPPLQRYEALMKQQSQELGLYNATDKVLILTDANFNETVLHQNRSALVEFYNSYCGHCKRFAPKYKQLAEQLYPWRDVLPVGAIDCAAEENNGICREYEIMAYPTLRYFGPGFSPGAENYGRPIETQDLDAITTTMAQWLVAENRTATMTAWPNLQSLSESDAERPFEGLDSQRRYIVLVYEPENSTIGTETALYLLRWPSVQVRRITDHDVAAKYGIDGERHKLATLDRKGTVVPYESPKDNARSYADTVESALRAEHLTERPTPSASISSTVATLQNGHTQDPHINEELLAEVKRNKHLVYHADLEMAIRGIIYNEIPKVADISGERLLALQRFLAVLQRYNPMGANGRALITGLYEFVMQFNQNLSGQQFEDELKRLESRLQPIFAASHYVGCVASRPGLRGFTCSLWQLFHFLTVQAARNEVSQDPLEVLQCIHGYVKFFLGCTDCSEHFQSMATRRKIWSTPNKDEAILWLWAAHNEVSQRLAGDATEDPQFPKIQFPSMSSCSQCYRQPMTPANSLETNWDKVAVLSFLKNIHNPEFISRYGLEHGELLHMTLEKLRQKRMISNVFTDMDMRMGMLLYGFCILMMIIAFKLFAFKGYRKKPYGHDILGKV